MDKQKQYETLAAIKAYANRIIHYNQDDVRPSSARFVVETIKRMNELTKQLEVES